MFPTGQPPYSPMGPFTGGFRQAGAQQGMMRFLSPMMNQATSGFNPFQMGAQGFGARAAGSQALGAAGQAAAKTGGAGWLGHMQTALKAIQGAAPMVKQYGPMVKNLPAMINMMKLMNESDEEETDEELESLSSSFQFESSSPAPKKAGKKKIKKSTPRVQGTSQPKLYI